MVNIQPNIKSLRLFIRALALAALFVTQATRVTAQSQHPIIDVLHYDVALEPETQSKTIKGIVKIRFITLSATNKVTFNCGDLIIDSVRSKGQPLQNSIADHRVEITLP